MKKIQFKKNYKKGFTLLETLIAVFILTLALTGPIYIATLAIRGSVESRDSISAYYLAQEAIELVRNTRDEDSFKGVYGGENGAFLKFGYCNALVGAPADQACDISYSNSTSENPYTINGCIEGSCPPLTFNANGINGVIYGVDPEIQGTINSKFSREIYIKSGTNGSVDLTVIVRWQDKGRDKQFKIIEKLYNQRYSQYYRQ